MGDADGGVFSCCCRSSNRPSRLDISDRQCNILEIVSHFTHANRFANGEVVGGLAAAVALVRRRFRGTGSWGGDDFTRYTTTNATINTVRNSFPSTLTMVCLLCFVSRFIVYDDVEMCIPSA